MGASNVYVIYAINTAGGLLDHIVDQNLDTGLNEIVTNPDGKVYGEFAATLSARPVTSFTTTGIASALAIIGVEFYAIAAAADMYMQKMTNFGKRAGATSHVKLSVNPGMIIPRTLTADQDDLARLTCDLIPISSDGSTTPIAITGSQSLAGTPATDEQYTVGAASLNNSTVDGVQSVTVDFGVQESIQAGKGLPYATFCGIMRIAPIVTIRTFDAALLATYAVPGAAISSATNVTFRQIVQGAVPNGTTKTLTVNEGRISARQIQVAEGEANIIVQVTPTYNGTNAPLVLS